MNQADNLSSDSMSVSVVIPVYNRADVLGRALRSVEQQTVTPFETIVVDDGSSDDIGRIIEEFPWVQCKVLATNGGASRARNLGVSQAKGDWIAFLDSDDAWQPDKLEKQLAFAMKHPTAHLICHGLVVQELSGKSTEFHAGNHHRLTISGIHTYPFSPSTWLIRRNVIRSMGGFDESFPNCEDWDLLARLLFNNEIVVMDEKLAVKYNRVDGLDANLRKSRVSYAYMLDRYPDLWARDRRGYSQNMRKLAHMHAQAGDSQQASRVLGRLLVQYPWLWRSWLMLVLLFLAPGYFLDKNTQNERQYQ